MRVHQGSESGEADLIFAYTAQMLFTWDTKNLCIVFSWWRLDGIFSILVSLAAVSLLSAGYELVRELSRRHEIRSRETLQKLPRT